MSWFRKSYAPMNAMTTSRTHKGKGMPVLVQNRQRQCKLPLRQLRRIVEQILQGEGFPDHEVSVSFVSDHMMRELNRLYRGYDRPTDVLAFSMREGQGTLINPHLLGDVVVSLDQARRQAAENGHSLELELKVLLIHGVLHLLGYDHETSRREGNKMRAKESRLLQALVEPQQASRLMG